MSYNIYFENDVPSELLRSALHEQFGMQPTKVYIGRLEDLAASGGPRPAVLITPPEQGEEFGWVLSGGDELAASTGMSELELARNLARATNTRAIVDDGTRYPNYWFLIARDGSYGRVLTNADADDDGHLRIVHAMEPISGEPDLPVVPLPDWAKDW